MRVPRLLAFLSVSLLLVFFLAPSSSSAESQQKKNEKNNRFPIIETRQYLTTTNNRKIYVAALKPFQKCAIVFVHGLFGSSQSWFYQYQLWDPNCSTVTYDMYGHGLSSGTLNKYDPDTNAKDLAQVLAWTKATSYVLVGHDHGGIAVQYYVTNTGKNDNQVKAMVLVGAFARNPNPFREGGDQPIVALLASKAFKQQAIVSAATSLINPFAPHDLPPRSWQIISGSALITNYVAANQIILSNVTFLKNNFNKPVLITYGTQDSIINSDAFSELKNTYKNSKYAKIERGCHSNFLQLPSVFNEALTNFLANVSWASK